MRKSKIKITGIKLKLQIGIYMALATSIFLLSFTLPSTNENFLNQLGIGKTDADKKISESILNGYLNQYGLKNAKNIVTGNREAVTKDLLDYVKNYVNSEAFIKEYAALKDNNKPKENKIISPDEMRNNNIESYKKSAESMEAMVLKADASSKAMYQQMLADTKKLLQEAEDPNNAMITEYAKGYPDLIRSFQETYKQQLNTWESEYPANHLLFVRKRLQQFLDETNHIDFTAELTTKGNKMIFVNPAYENKSLRWKMAFRAGKEVIEPARAFARKWIDEIK